MLLKNNTILLPNNIRIQMKEIVHLKADGAYTFIYLNSGKRMLVSSSLKKVYQTLEPFGNLVRIHKSVAINKAFVRSVTDDFVLLLNGVELQAARRKLRILQGLKTELSA